jgi:hypothetical protein
VIVHQGEVADLDAERDGEQFEAEFDPLLAVIEILAGDRIEFAEECASHAAIVTVIDTEFIGSNDLFSGASGHK